jgi:lipopolysaccharide transport system permease protein
MQTSTVVGSPLTNRFDATIPLFRHRSLLWQFILRNVELRHKGSHLGLVWSILNPLLMLAVYVLVFGVIFGGKGSDSDNLGYALNLFVGLSLFHLIAEVLGTAPGVIVGNPNFVKKVVFPLEILPAASVGAAFVHFLTSLGLTLVGTLLLGPKLSWTVLWLPVILLPFLLLNIGIAWFVAALGVFLRDISQVTGFLSTALMFASAIFYPAAMIPEKSPLAWSILRFNPIIHANELCRDAILRHLPMNFGSLGYLYLAGFGSALIGYLVFTKLRPTFADVI